MSSVAINSDVISSSTFTDIGNSGRISTLGFSFFSSDDRKTLLPHNIRRFLTKNKSGKNVSEHFEANGRAFVTFNEALQFADTKFLTCPHSGISVPYGKENTGVLCKYLKSEFPEVFESLKKSSRRNRIDSIYIYPDCYSVNRRFINYKFPGKSFSSKSELDIALKNGFPIGNLETPKSSPQKTPSAPRKAPKEDSEDESDDDFMEAMVRKHLKKTTE